MSFARAAGPRQPPPSGCGRGSRAGIGRRLMERSLKGEAMKTKISVCLLLASALALGAAQAKSPAKHARHASPGGGYVGAAAARRAATRAVHGRVLSTKLENEEGKMQYAVMVKDRAAMHEVMVDAHTGKVVSQEKVTAAEEAREAAQEAKAARSKHHSALKGKNGKAGEKEEREGEGKEGNH